MFSAHNFGSAVFVSGTNARKYAIEAELTFPFDINYHVEASLTTPFYVQGKMEVQLTTVFDVLTNFEVDFTTPFDTRPPKGFGPSKSFKLVCEKSLFTICG